MILLTNGCSWTYGGGLGLDDPKDNENRLQSVWPHHLGKLLDTDSVVNLAMGCGSNPRIVRTTLEYFLQNTPKEPIIAVIQFTDPFRFELYNSNDINDWNNDTEKWARVTNSGYIDCGMNLDFMKNLLKVNVETYTHIHGMYQLITQTLALVKLFEMYDVRYYLWDAFTTLNIYPKKYIDFIKKFHILDPGGAWMYDRISQKDNHPSILGHKQIAELIYKDIKP